MPRVVLTSRANAGLDEIWLHVAQDNLSAADALIDRLVGRCDSLAEHPKLGPSRPEIAAEARMLVVDSYLILYRVTGEGVEIVRVVYGARLFEGLFDDQGRG